MLIKCVVAAQSGNDILNLFNQKHELILFKLRQFSVVTCPSKLLIDILEKNHLWLILKHVQKARKKARYGMTMLEFRRNFPDEN